MNIPSDPGRLQVPLSPAHAGALHPQRGAALATALFFLAVLTILGLAAMRSGTLGLRLSENEAGRMDAQQNAQTAIDSVRAYGPALDVLPGSGYLQSCAIGSKLDATKLQQQQGFSCPSTNVVAALLPNTAYKPYLYLSVYRERIGSDDYVPVNAVREGDSSDRYQLAAFTLTGGYDRIASDDAVAKGGAEVGQGVYVKVAKIKGLTQQ